MRGAGNASNYWARTASPLDLSAYYLTFDDAHVDPANYYIRWLGFTVWNIFLKPKTICESPIYLTRGGYIYLVAGSLAYAGSGSGYWSRTTDISSEQTYSLYITRALFYQSDSNARWNGFMVREIFARRR